MRLHIDFETRCLVDLKVRGLEAYVRDPSLDILLTGWAVDDGPVYVVEGLPWLVRELLGDPAVTLHAFNAAFERGVLGSVGVDVPLNHVHCTMVDAYIHGFSGGLADVAKQTGIEHQKQRNALKFCKPRSRLSKANQNLFWEKEDDPEGWAAFVEYCRQDVEAERDLWRFLRRADEGTYPTERRIWCLDQKINARGLPVDMRLVENALKVDAAFKERGEAEFKEITDFSSGQVAALLGWAKGRGYPGDDMQAGTIQSALDQRSVTPECARALELRLELSQAATAKFKKIQDIQVDGRIYNTLQLRGASRTGRWAGRGLQLQNLKRPMGLDVDTAVWCLRKTPELFPYLFGLDDLGSLIRSAICAGDGRALVVADLASIESRVLGWVTGCGALNDVFARGADPYKAFAVLWLHKSEDQITKSERNMSKPPALGCGYGLSPTGRDGTGGLVAYASGMGIEMTSSEAKEAVRVFRTNYPQIVSAWRSLDQAWAEVVTTGEGRQTCRCIFRMEARFLTIELPSGRKLWYLDPRVDEDCASYMGQDAYTHQWTRIRSWGGKLCVSGDTMILSDRGWIPIHTLGADWRVFDGVEFVAHGGIIFNGEQDCVSVDGVHMTPDHEVFTSEGWKEASQLQGSHGPKIRYADTDPSLSVGWQKVALGLPVRLWRRNDQARNGLEEGRQGGEDSKLRMLNKDAYRGEEYNPRNEQAPRLRSVEVDDRQMPSPHPSGVEELRGKGDLRLRKMGGFPNLLGGPGGRVLPGDECRTDRQQRELLPGERSLDTAGRSSEKQEEHATLRRQSGVHEVRNPEVHDPLPLAPRAVYDILNAGPRKRFMVLGHAGPFLVHNCENIVQAVACDILEHGLIGADDAGLNINGHVHDEVIIESDAQEAEGDLKTLVECMTAVPAWGKGLILAAEGYVSQRYRKG